MKKFELGGKNTFAFLMLRHHWPYVFALVFFLVLSVVFIPIQLNSYLDLRVELDSVIQEITRLENEKRKIESYNGVDLDESYAILNAAFPDKPDRFSLFNNVAILQEQHEILIQNFSSPFGDSADELVGINVSSLSSLEGFRGLINDYFFHTGKLTTLDRVFFDTTTNDLNFTIYFHSKETSPDEGIIFANDDELLAQIQEIRKVIQALGNTSSTPAFSGDIDENYSSKDNPFAN